MFLSIVITFMISCFFKAPASGSIRHVLFVNINDEYECVCRFQRLASQMRPSRNNLFHLYLWVINKPVQRINYQIVMVSTSLLLAIERDAGESHIINVLWGVWFLFGGLGSNKSSFRWCSGSGERPYQMFSLCINNGHPFFL